MSYIPIAEARGFTTINSGKAHGFIRGMKAVFIFD